MANPGGHAAGASEPRSGQSLPAASIKDVAAAAGVSTATVSRALRGLPCVSQSTRQRIQAAADDLGYVASSAASELARKRGARKARPLGQPTRLEPPAPITATSPPAGAVEVADYTASPGRGTILVVTGGPVTGSGKPDERPTPTPGEIERLVQSVAADHGFTARVMFFEEADVLPGFRPQTGPSTLVAGDPAPLESLVK